MGSEHKSKKRGRSSSPAKKKPKRKYRNDRSKKSHQSSSESSSTEEDVSLTSDEYPSSAEERRKEAKKKRSKKAKRKDRGSASSSRSPSPEKVKKKSKVRDEKEESKKDKYKKERKRSSSKKKRRRSRSDDSESSDSRGRSPVKKEKSKKKHSPSPIRVKKKKSVSPSPMKETDRVEKKKKKSVSPVRSKKKISPSPPRKRSKSPSPVRSKKNKSPTRHVGKKESVDHSPPRSKRRSVSPSTNKYKPKSPPPRSRKKSTSPPPKKETKTTPVPSNATRKSPTPNRPKREDQTPAPRIRSNSPPPHRFKKENQSPAPKKKSRSPTSRQRKKESESPRLRMKSRSPPPNRPKMESTMSEVRGKSPPPYRPKKESQCEAPMLKHKSPIPSRPKKEKSPTPIQPKKEKSPTPSRPKKEKSPTHNGAQTENQSPAPVSKSPAPVSKSPTPNRPTKESQSQATKKETRSPSPDRRKIESPSSISRKTSKSPIPTIPGKEDKNPIPTIPGKEDKSPIPTIPGKEDKIPIPTIPGKEDKNPVTIQPALKGPSPTRPVTKIPASTDVKQEKRCPSPIINPIPSATELQVDEDKYAITCPLLPPTINVASIPLISANLDVATPTELKEISDTISEKKNTISDKNDATSDKTDIVSNKIETSSDKIDTLSNTPVVPAEDIKDPLSIVPEKKVDSPSTPRDPVPVPIKHNEAPPIVISIKSEKAPSLFKRNDGFGIKKGGSAAIFRSRKKSPSPGRNRRKSRSPSPGRIRKRSRSPSPTRVRRRSKSPKRDRKRSRSRSPARYRKDERVKSPSKQRRRSRSGSPSRSKKDRDRSPDKDSKKRKNDDKRKDDDRIGDKKDRDDKDKEKPRRSDDHRRGRDDRSNKDDNKDRRKKDEKEQKTSKRDKSPDKKDIGELEEEMRKRKERIEAWRNANRKKEETDGDKPEPEKKWSLEDDESEEEEQPTDIKEEEMSTEKEATEQTQKKDVKKEEIKEEPEEVDEDLDALDSFMKSIEVEVNKITGRNTAKPTNTTTGTKTKTITVLKTVVSITNEQAKPEIMEQNQDALEYSSEEEGTKDIQASDFTDATKKKKELTVADHTKIYYAPFRRNFYVEVPELARMTADEVKLLRDSLGDIQVRGKNIPKPIKTWAQAGLSSKVMNVLKRCQYEKPTPIQAQALPIAMSGRDMIGIAKTGSGKTLAFVLPMLRHVLDQPALDEDDGPLAVIMTPTRELALQIHRESKKFCKALNLNVTCIYGGSGISEQIAELKRGTEIIVCTPGRMIDMLAANNGRVTNCRRCTYLVLDEADRMFDMGFEPQVMRILDNIRPDRQTVLFSATFPRQMEAMARKVLTKPIEVQVGGRSVVCSDVEQHATVIDEDNKFFKVLELLGVYQDRGSILLFVERQETADRLFKDLLKKGYPCLSLHGGMDQFDRDSTIADFKNGVTTIMVSTSVAARGLDVKNLNLVVNYDCPNHYEDYVHRVGRTGRAGNKGTAFTFVTPEQGRNAGDIIKAFELSKCELPEAVLELWNSFRADMEKEGKTIKMNSGFSGKGFKFNAEEDAQVNEEKKMRKFTLGLQDSDDEAEAAENAMDKIEADLEKIFSSKPKVALQPEVVEAQKVKVAEQNVDKDKLKQASTIAALINKKLSSGQVMDRNTAATAHIMQGGALESLTGVGLAKQLADKVNAKLNYKAAEVESQVDEKPTLVRYEEEIDINDFPQQARWRITSKEIIEQVRELSEAGVTVRGLYIPPNKKPTDEEKRLHLYIESLSERSIQIAKAEIKRLLKEELIKSESHTYRPAQQTGRYKVL